MLLLDAGREDTRLARSCRTGFDTDERSVGLVEGPPRRANRAASRAARWRAEPRGASVELSLGARPTSSAAETYPSNLIRIMPA